MVRRLVAVILGLTVLALLAVNFTYQPKASSGTPGPIPTVDPFSIAVIGDVPYSEAQLTSFRGLADRINQDRDVKLVAHLGDIKNSESPCSDAYYTRIAREFNRLTVPLVYTPGDNEWADCHKPANGSFNPFERLAKLREVFFDVPNTTLIAQTTDYATWAEDGYTENIRFRRGGATFGAMNVVGANNGLQTWTGQKSPGPEQVANVKSRTDAAIGVIDDVFATAEDRGDRAVVFFMQADMFNPNPALQNKSQLSAFEPIVKALAKQSAEFPGTVYLFDGDTHRYLADTPLQKDSRWLKFYGVKATANFKRVTVDGDTAATGYLRVRVDGDSADPVTWQRVPAPK